jgi:predicted transglutaminase-like cysteine proteinase
MLRSLIALSLFMASTATSQADLSIPVDTAARAKFPQEDPEFIDTIAAINRLVNDGIQGESDGDHYGIADYWVMMPADGKGDCEDYALTKIFLLGQSGFPTVTNLKLVGVIVHRKGDSEGHAILALLLPKGEVAYLDNLNTEPMTRAELVAQGYQFFDWRA